jgi:hypothetical protein
MGRPVYCLPYYNGNSKLTGALVIYFVNYNALF